MLRNIDWQLYILGILVGTLLSNNIFFSTAGPGLSDYALD